MNSVFIIVIVLIVAFIVVFVVVFFIVFDIVFIVIFVVALVVIFVSVHFLFCCRFRDLYSCHSCHYYRFRESFCYHSRFVIVLLLSMLLLSEN